MEKIDFKKTTTLECVEKNAEQKKPHDVIEEFVSGWLSRILEKAESLGGSSWIVWKKKLKTTLTISSSGKSWKQLEKTTWFEVAWRSSSDSKIHNL